MAGKALSPTPLVHPSAHVRASRLGIYTEVGARTMLLEVAIADYSYVVNDSDIAYATIGKFCSIAAMTRINPGNHPMQRASQSHFTYRASAYFPGETDEEDFFAWRRAHQVHDRSRRLDRPRRDHPARAARSAPARWWRPARSSPRTCPPTRSSPAIRRAGPPAFPGQHRRTAAGTRWWDWSHERLRARLPDFRHLVGRGVSRQV